MVIPAAGEDIEPEVTLDDVEAGHLQAGMLLYAEDTDRVFVVAGEPAAFQRQDGDRPTRWVQITLVGAEPIEARAIDRVDVVYGAELATLQPMLDPDLYTDETEALARNGMCPEQLDATDPADPAGNSEPPEPMYCGRPSDPGSYFRACTECDTLRRQHSAAYERRSFDGTYRAYPAPM